VTEAQPFVYALAVIYALTGAACAAAATASGRMRARITDTLLLLLLWPLYGPFLLAGPSEGAWRAPGLTRSRERDLWRASRQVAGTPLARLLPDRAAVRSLARALRAAASRVREIDDLLARPDMAGEAVEAALQRAEEAAGSIEARSALVLRLQSIRQLRSMRDRLARRLAEVDALLAQLLTQVEVLRLGGPADAPGEELVGELLTRVEALGEMLEDGRRAAAIATP
jgi:hypothetical protein